ncbi:MAG: ABC-F family ATP-binding cassette domain-containing protein [Lunatimonas sp.]|uniref:ABC-F family ATP-binding cassette domain-containing protein n=1 Tax=Lunatimonas sp. TaxID=2060141 RepID=UPI00263B406C|nr:ABC-F family ATP-binding cassette domain-containing protein [Lunatimonas sp.]MCC5939361.1 ABC-F family ATP-binding cassette domain-containing protein [Lunatimonas sp.]
MNYLSVEGLTKSYGERVLFQQISFGIDQGQKVALVGINGAGKSTLMKIIMGVEVPDAGTVAVKQGVKVSYVNQNPVFGEGLTILQALFEDTTNETLQVIKAYQQEMLASQRGEDNQDKLQSIFERMDALQAWDYEFQVNEVLGKLGLHDTGISVQELSGGQRKRVALAKAILERPDLMLLDEPTNHLDLETIEWLEEYLSKANLSLLMVTHDRYFLEKVTNQILELDDSRIFRYAGSYSYFLEKKEERKQVALSEQEKAKSLYKKELDWIRRQPKARGTKAKYRVDAFEATKEKALRKKDEREVTLEVKTSRLGKKIIEIEDLSKSYEDKQILDKFSYTFKRGDRIGIVGPNGAGKTTFLKLLTGEAAPDSGSISIGETTAFGYYRQEETAFDDTKKLIDIVKDVAEVVTLAGGSTITVSQFLTQFGFPPKQQHTPVGKLSGGEKRRLQLLMVLIKSPNFLILDEPTNDLDIVTLNTLEDFLDQFPGCLLIVSHDRYFMDRLVEHIFVFEGEGAVSDFPGNYTDLREYQKEQRTEAKEMKRSPETEKVVETVSAPAGTTRKATYKEVKEFEGITQALEDLAGKKEALVAALNSPGENHERLMELSKGIQEIEDEIGALELRWLELSELEGIG